MRRLYGPYIKFADGYVGDLTADDAKATPEDGGQFSSDAGRYQVEVNYLRLLHQP